MPHDGGVHPAPTGLPLLRRLTLWTLLGCVAFAGVIVVIEASALSRPVSVAATLATVLACATAAALFARQVPRTLVGAAVIAAATVVALARIEDTGGFPWVLPLAAVTAAACAVWPSLMVAFAGTVLAFLAALAGSRISWTDAAVDAAITALCTAGLYGQVWVLQLAERLDRARHVDSAAAVAEERLRFAADLHDIQGHNLQVIALKSELAERLVSADPVRAAAEMREVQQLARRALGDTREVVHGYRAVSLGTEVSNAARVLRAAGIEVSVSVDPGVPLAAANLLALVVRECTTNVLRHSAASRCDIAVSAGGDAARLRFANDRPLSAVAGPAGGLAGLTARLAAAGGDLDVEGTATSFTVCVTVPESP